MFKFPIVRSILIVVYVFLVGLVLNNGQKFFGNTDQLLGVSAFLLLFVLSAAVVGFLFLSQPVILYTSNHKRKAVFDFLKTCFWLLVWVMVLFGVMMVIR